MLRLRHYSHRTEAGDVGWVGRLVLYAGRRHPRDLGGADVERFLSHLAVDRRVAATTRNPASAALLFLDRDARGVPSAITEPAARARHRPRAPVVLTRNAVWRVLDALGAPPAGPGASRS